MFGNGTRTAGSQAFACVTSEDEQTRTIFKMISRPVIAITAKVFCALTFAVACSATVLAGSEVYIEQAHGQVAPGSAVMTKPTPETAAQTSQPPAAAVAPTAPDTCNAQNASSSQACYTATQQARPASH